MKKYKQEEIDKIKEATEVLDIKSLQFETKRCYIEVYLNKCYFVRLFKSLIAGIVGICASFLYILAVPICIIYFLGNILMNLFGVNGIVLRLKEKQDEN